MTQKEKREKRISGIITALVMILIIIILSLLSLKYEYPPPEPKKVLLIEMTALSGGGGGGGGGNQGSVQPRTSQSAPVAGENVVTASAQPDVALPSIPVSKRQDVATPTDGAATDAQPVVNPVATFRPGMGGGSGSGSGTGTGSGFGSGIGPGSGSGNGGGSGSGTGSGTGGGIGHGTGGRGHVFMPDLTVSEVGRVYVEVHVAADGTVLDARVINTSTYPTTITNAKIREECVRKAKTAKYKPGKEELRVILFK